MQAQVPGPQIVTASSTLKVILLKRGRALLSHLSSIPKHPGTIAAPTV
jgi:hypothetical protein